MTDATRPTNAATPAIARRAEAWVHGVVNPLLDTLPTEIALLERGNITFNCDAQDLRHIRRVEETLTSPARHVLRDFMRANPDAQAPIGARDAAIGPLVIAARAAYGELQQNTAFRAAVRALTAPARGPESSPAAGLVVATASGIDPDQLTRAFGEFVVNRRGQMSDFESDFAPVWNRERAGLLAHRSGVEFINCDDATTALLAADRHLVTWLEDKSFHLCEHFGIAAAPVGEGR